MNFTCKARYVSNGANTDTLVRLCYLIVVSLDSVRIEFLVAALNDLDILACDIYNAFLNALGREIIWFVAGMECGKSLEGKVMKLVPALYGLKRSGASWRKIFKYNILNCLGLPPINIDPGMYYRHNTK